MQNFAIFLYFIFPINMLTHYVYVMCIYTQTNSCKHTHKHKCLGVYMRVYSMIFI